jgi:hypothetical protein
MRQSLTSPVPAGGPRSKDGRARSSPLPSRGQRRVLEQPAGRLNEDDRDADEEQYGEAEQYRAQQIGHREDGEPVGTLVRARSNITAHAPQRATFAQKRCATEPSVAGSAITTTPLERENPRCAGASQVGGTGLEPVTPSLSSWCSPN